MLRQQGESHYSVLESALRIHKPLSQGLPPPWSLPSSIKDSSWRGRLCSCMSCPKQSFLPTTVQHNFSCCQKAASNQLPIHYWWYYLPEAKLDAHLTDRHSADAGVQESCGRVGTHFTHKGEFLFPADTVFLNFLSMRKEKKKFKYRYKAKSRSANK